MSKLHLLWSIDYLLMNFSKNHVYTLFLLLLFIAEKKTTLFRFYIIYLSICLVTVYNDHYLKCILNLIFIEVSFAGMCLITSANRILSFHFASVLWDVYPLRLTFFIFFGVVVFCCCFEQSSLIAAYFFPSVTMHCVISWQFYRS